LPILFLQVTTNAIHNAKSKLVKLASEREALRQGQRLVWVPAILVNRCARRGRTPLLRYERSWRNCGHPIEEIFRKILIPKLYAKEIKVITSRGKTEIRVVDDRDIQLKIALERAKMCGCYTADESDGEKDSTGETSRFDFRDATEDEVDAILKILAGIRKRNSVGQSEILQAKPRDMALGR
jgi:hypothetical protein